MASVTGQSPATAPELARPRVSLRVHMGRVRQTPPFVDRGMVDEPTHRARPQRRDAVFDLPDLLGRVDMDRPGSGEGNDLRKLFRRHRAQTVRRNAERLSGRVLDQAAAVVDQAGEGGQVVDEPPLLRFRRRAAEGRVGVKDRQQRQADSSAARRRDDALGHFRTRRVGRSVGSVMEIVEFADGGETRLQHLDIELRRDRLDVVRRHRQRKPIHGFAPGPERVPSGAAEFSEAGHAALEGVAVQVRRRRRQDRMAFVPFGGRGAAFKGGDRSALDRHPHAGFPALRSQRRGGMND